MTESNVNILNGAGWASSAQSSYSIVFEPPKIRLATSIKRIIDLVIAVPLTFFLAPWLLTIAAAIKLTSRGPVFFRQKRLGFRGRPFTILKFRTMTVMEDGPSVQQAARNDMRVTAVGRFLRRSSLDELPQLFNVIRGDMSLIGPRQHAVAHDEFFATLIDHYEIRQHVKPGISGWPS